MPGSAAQRRSPQPPPGGAHRLRPRDPAEPETEPRVGLAARLGLRLRIALFFAALALGGAACLAAALWFGHFHAGGAASGYAIAGLAAGFAWVGLCAWVALLFDENVSRPILGLAADLHARAQSDVRAEIDAAPARHLGALAPAACAIHEALEEARTAQERAVAERTARMARDAALLGSVVRDLPEAVVAVAADGRIMLYNPAAVALLGPLGLGRPLSRFLDSAPLDAAAERRRALGDAGPAPFLTTAGEGETARTLAGALSAATPDAAPLARVLVLRDAMGQRRAHDRLEAQRPETLEAMPRLAEDARSPADFYTFDLPPAGGPEADRLLSELVCVVFDTETTGLDPAADEVVQIAGLRLLGGRAPRGETFEALANPGRPIPSASVRVHGVTDAMVADAPPFAEVAVRFADFCEGAALVAHNAPFDMAFLRRLEAEGGPRFDAPALCTARLSRRLHAHVSDHTLDALALRLGVEIPPERRHTALGDALATAEAFQRMIPLLAARGVHTLGQALSLQGPV